MEPTSLSRQSKGKRGIKDFQRTLVTHIVIFTQRHNDAIIPATTSE